MKKNAITGLAVVLTLACFATLPASANNSSVEARMKDLGDLSMFYQAMLSTGVLGELQEGQHYTIFAPTNAALDQISPREYPCFYSAQCRPQIAALVRDHILVGSYNLKELATYGGGIATAGLRPAYVEEAFVGDYTIDGVKILSQSDADGNMIYRIDNLLASPRDMAQFQTINDQMSQDTLNTEPGEITETTTIIQRTIVQP